jgi:hypothetical protein
MPPMDVSMWLKCRRTAAVMPRSQNFPAMVRATCQSIAAAVCHNGRLLYTVINVFISWFRPWRQMGKRYDCYKCHAR